MNMTKVLMVIGILLNVFGIGCLVFLFIRNKGKNGYQRILFNRIKESEICIFAVGIVFIVYAAIGDRSFLAVPLVATLESAVWVYVSAKITYAKELKQKAEEEKTHSSDE